MSGLAKGIDIQAHGAAIDRGGRTCAVIGTPLDRCYPAESKRLPERSTNRVSAAVVPSTDGPSLGGFIAFHMRVGAKVYTDENATYLGLPNHAAVKHGGVGEYVKDQAHINRIESSWSMLKRNYYGTYHHLNRSVSEFEGRHDQRSHHTIDQMAAMVWGVSGKRLGYSDLVA